MQACFKLSVLVLSFLLQFLSSVLLGVLSTSSGVAQSIAHSLPSSLHVAWKTEQIYQFESIFYQFKGMLCVESVTIYAYLEIALKEQGKQRLM